MKNKVSMSRVSKKIKSINLDFKILCIFVPSPLASNLKNFDSNIRKR